MEIQAHHPSATIFAYLDDTYYLDKGAEARAAALTGEVVTLRLAVVSSNRKKKEGYSLMGDLSEVPGTIRGSPLAQPPADGQYAGGRLLVLKVLGAHIRDTAEASRWLVQRFARKLAPLAEVVLLRDIPGCNVSIQVAQMIRRYCANTWLSYFLRTMDTEVAAAAAALHDQLVGDALHRLLHMHLRRHGSAST